MAEREDTTGLASREFHVKRWRGPPRADEPTGRRVSRGTLSEQVDPRARIPYALDLHERPWRADRSEHEDLAACGLQRQKARERQREPSYGQVVGSRAPILVVALPSNLNVGPLCDPRGLPQKRPALLPRLQQCDPKVGPKQAQDQARRAVPGAQVDEGRPPQQGQRGKNLFDQQLDPFGRAARPGQVDSRRPTVQQSQVAREPPRLVGAKGEVLEPVVVGVRRQPRAPPKRGGRVPRPRRPGPP